mgnify:FL=1
MKKILLSTLVTALALPLLATSVSAKNKNKGFVFVPQEMAVETIADAKDKADDTIVVLQGYIAKSLGGDKYAFTDKTGEIIIEIDDDEFDGVSVTSGEMIEIMGEIDKDSKKPVKVEVKTIKKLDNPMENTLAKHMKRSKK